MTHSIFRLKLISGAAVVDKHKSLYDYDALAAACLQVAISSRVDQSPDKAHDGAVNASKGQWENEAERIHFT